MFLYPPLEHNLHRIVHAIGSFDREVAHGVIWAKHWRIDVREDVNVCIVG
jgi:hypothetical protein